MDSDPDPLVGGMDPRIRILIHTKMLWIRNTSRNTGLLSRVADPERIHSYQIQVLKLLLSYFTKEKYRYCGIRVHSIPVFKNTGVLLIDGSLFATLF
jgi:hypothetical protein